MISGKHVIYVFGSAQAKGAQKLDDSSISTNSTNHTGKKEPQTQMSMLTSWICIYFLLKSYEIIRESAWALQATFVYTSY